MSAPFLRCVIPGLLATALFLSGPGAVTINTGTTYQTLEGIGGAASMPGLYQKAGVFFVDRPLSYEYDRLCIDMGATALRFLMGSEGSYIARGTYDWSAVQGMISVMKECIARGSDQFLISILNPPGWAKSNGIITNGGSLLDAEYDGFAEYAAQLCKVVKEATGVDPYALSMQNEPLFPEPYGSCVYTDANLSRLTSMAKAKLTAPGLTTHMVGPEDVFSNQGLNWPTMRDNPDVHGYAGHHDPNWSTALNYIAGKNKQLWMTESDIFPSEWTAGLQPNDYMTVGSRIINALNGGVTWWMWFSYNNNFGAGVAGTDGVDTM